MNNNSNLSREDRLALIVLAIVQSLLLLFLHKAINHTLWPSTSPEWLYALYTLTLGLPLFLYLGFTHWKHKANGVAAVFLGLVLFGVGWHNGWLTAPTLGETDYRYYGGTWILGTSLFVALFIVGFFFRTWFEQGRLDYGGLLLNSWRNALSLSFLCLFIGVFWLLLFLWAGLFKILDIDFFADLFGEPGFIYPVTGLVGGWGLGLIRDRESLIVTVRNLCESLTQALLPLVSFILILFLAALPFTGLEPLWNTGFAASLMLWLAVILLYFFNVAIAEHERPFSGSVWLYRLMLLALLLLPLAVFLAGWSLGVRIEQYGLTVSRLWGLLVTAFLALFSLGYAVLIGLHRGVSLARVRQWNTSLGAALVVVLILVHTPLLDFHRLATASQIARLEQGVTQPEEFDARYLRFDLGAYGINALKALQASEQVAGNSQLKNRIERALKASSRWEQQMPAQQDDLQWRRGRFRLLPGTEVSDQFLATLDLQEQTLQTCLRGEVHCVLGDLEYRDQRYRVTTSTRSYWARSRAWQWVQGQWRELGQVQRFGCSESSPVNLDQPFQAIESDFFLFTQEGGCLYQIQPSSDYVREVLTRS